MYVGVDYYPEHWPETRWALDAQMMQKAGFNVVRLGEFAWTNFEPAEGCYDFAWLDRALEVLARHGIRAILGTPTAVVPAWLAHRYPEVMVVDKTGQRRTWGVRKDTCYSSGVLRRFSQAITTALATHYASHPGVIGWQTDNEFGGSNDCRCPACQAAFQDFLRQRYGTLDELNRAWGTHFWGQIFRAWEEVPVIVDTNGQNPSACLDWQRFYSDQNVRYQGEQVQILRRLCPRHFITHNLMGLAPDVNYFNLARDLDFVSWDNYPVWGRPEVRYDAALAADLMRGAKHKNFWIMEQTAGPCGWGSFNRNVRPGELRAVAYQQLAHGADGQIWFRWRTCTAGREQYWHGLLQHDGKPNRRYLEAAQVAREYHLLAPLLEGLSVRAEVAMIYDYDSLWVTRFQGSFEGNDYREQLKRYHRALFRAGIGLDIISPADDFSRYKLVIAPELHLMPDALARRLEAYIEQGGTLLADVRTAVKDGTNLVHDRTLPGLLSSALGIAIPEYDVLADKAEIPLTQGFAGHKATLYTDWIKPTTAETVAGYDAWWLTDYAAITRNRLAKGIAWYVGTIGNTPAFYDGLIARVLADAGITAPLTPPPGVEAVVRSGQGRELLFLINHTEDCQTVPVPTGRKELLTGTTTATTLTLDRHGVAVVQLR